MANKIVTKVLNTLLDKYERSKTFIGQNKNEQNFKIIVGKEFPKYEDDSEYEYFKEINSSLGDLERKKYITLSKERSGKIEAVFLNPEKLEEVYSFLKRKPKSELNSNIQNLLADYIQLGDEYKPLSEYAKEQMDNIKQNKNILYFDYDYQEYSDVLVLSKAVLENKEEIFVRELSVKLFNDSKRLEKIEFKTRSLLFNYGDYDDKETVFEEHNILKTPTYVMVKGKGILNFGQTIDLSEINGDIGFSTKTLNQLVSVDLQGAEVVTIENLTNFHRFQPNNQLVIYLGGFHNSIKRDFIQKVNTYNQGTKFMHFGDIDVGGFYILKHLKKKTGIAFSPLNMNIETLLKFKSYWKPLTENDRSRLQKLLSQNPEYTETLQFMIENNCKLEQEAEY